MTALCKIMWLPDNSCHIICLINDFGLGVVEAVARVIVPERYIPGGLVSGQERATGWLHPFFVFYCEPETIDFDAKRKTYKSTGSVKYIIEFWVAKFYVGRQSIQLASRVAKIY